MNENLKKRMRRCIAALMAAAMVLPSGALPVLADGNAGAAEAENLALTATATATEFEAGTQNTVDKINDGINDSTHRWASNQKSTTGDWAASEDDGLWVQLAWDEVQTMQSFSITWERLNIPEYQLLVSDDGESWTAVWSAEEAPETNTVDISLEEAVQAKYLRVNISRILRNVESDGTLEWTAASIFELEVYHAPAHQYPVFTQTPDEEISVYAGEPVEFTLNVADAARIEVSDLSGLSGAAVDAQPGICSFCWTPAETNAGNNYRVVFTAYGNTGRTASCAVAIKVLSALENIDRYPVSEDAHVQTWSSEKTQNYGSRNHLTVNKDAAGSVGEGEVASDSSDNKLAFLRFDLSGFPQADAIREAELSLTYIGCRNSVPADSTDKLLAAVVPSDSERYDWAEGEVTWETKPEFTVSEGAAAESAEYSLSNSMANSAANNASVSIAGTKVNINVTDFVKAALQNGEETLTLAVNEASGYEHYFVSSEGIENYTNATEDMAPAIIVKSPRALSVRGPQSLELAEGYAETVTEAFQIQAAQNPVVELSGEFDGKISWDAETCGLRIAEGLAAGTYEVTVTVKEGGQESSCIFTLYVLGKEPAGYVVDGVYDGWEWDTGTAQGENTVCEITADGWLHTNGSGSNEAPAVFVNPNTFDFTEPGYFEYDLQSIYSEKFGLYFDYGDPGYGLLFGYDNGGWYYQKYGGDYSWTPVEDRKARRPEEGKTVHVRVSWNGNGEFSLKVDDIQAFTDETSTLENHRSDGRIGIACYNANVKLENINYTRDGIYDGYQQDEISVKSDDAVCEVTEDGWLHLKGGTGNGADAKDPELYPAVFVNPFEFDFTKDGYFQFDMEQISDANTKFGVYLNYERPDQAILLGYDGGGWYWEMYHGNGTSDWYDGERVAAPGEGGKKNVQISWTADGAFYLYIDGEKVFSDAFQGLNAPEYRSDGKIAFSCSGATDVKVQHILSTRGSAAITGLTVSPAEQEVSTAKDPVLFETAFKNMANADAQVTWQSENPEVARINRDGEIVLVGAGDARVTATAELLGRQVSVSASLTYTPDGSEEEDAYLAANLRPFLQEDLKAAIEEAKADYDAGQGKYTDESWNAFKAAYESAAAEGTVDSDNETLKSLTAALKETQSQLEEPVPVDKSEIDRMLDYIAMSMIMGGPGYTSESLDVLEDAEREAKKVKADEDATQEEVDEVVRKLKDAFNNLKLKEIPPEVEAAREALIKALEAADPVYKAGQGEYTTESWQAFENAYKEAKDHRFIFIMDAGELNKITAALVNAQKNLAKPTPPDIKQDVPVNQNPTPPADGTDTPADTVRKGDMITAGKIQYKVTDAAKKTVEVAKGVNQKSVVIPATVTKNGIKFKVTAIGAGAFKGFGKVTSVTIGKNVKTIGRQSFFNCKKLGKVTFKGTAVPSVQTKAFQGTKGKIQVNVPKKMKAKQKNSLKKKLKKAGMSSKVTVK